MEEQNKSDALTGASAEKKQSIKNFIKNLRKNTESGNEYYKALCDVIDSEGVESQIKVKKKKISKKDERKLAGINKKREKKGLEPVDMIYVKRTGFKVFICFLFICFLVGMGGVTILAKWMSQAPDIDLTKFEYNDATVVYDTNGDEYQALQSREMREPIEIEEVPELVQLAFISIEDQRFYSHFGVDIRGTMKAVVNVLTSGSTDGPGGSTITQQLIKLTHLSSETSIKRKVMEWYLSVKLENTIEKREILEAYLNKVNMSDTWGIESAAQHYFGVSSNQLSVAQAAVLASIINSPAFYNPYNYLLDDEGSYYIEKTVLEDGSILYGYNPENQARALEVVAKMYELGYIRQAEYLVAKDELENNKIGLIKPQFLSTYSYFTDAVYQQVVSDLMEEYGYSEDDATDMVLNGGLNIYSTVDPVIQTTMEKYAQDSSIFPSQSSTAKEASKILSEINGEETNLIPQVGSAVIENSTGYVVGLVGGRDKTVNLSLNRALEHYQVGSTTKPLTVYSAGVDTGRITLASTFDDSRYRFSGGWTPVNHGGASTKSMMTVREGLRTSVNIVAVLAQMKVGDTISIEYAKRYGLELTLDGVNNDANASALALGGYVNGQTPLAMASAYTVFGNGGYRITPTLYKYVTNADGVVILTAKQERVEVISAQTAWLINSVLKQVVKGGTTYITLAGQEVGGKTGTTDSNKAVWFCGFTSKYSCATRYGYDYDSLTLNNKTYNFYIGTSSGSSRGPAEYFRKVFSSFYKEKKLPNATLMARPSGIISATVDAESGMAVGELTQKTNTEFFIAGTAPSEPDDMHQVFTVCAVSGKYPNEYCATEEKVIFVKDDSRLLPSGAKRLTGETELPTEEDPCTVCNSENMGMDIYGVTFSRTSIVMTIGESATATLTDSFGNALKVGNLWCVSDNESGLSTSMSGSICRMRALLPGTYTVTGGVTLNAGTNKETTYTAFITVVVNEAPQDPEPEVGDMIRNWLSHRKNK